MGVTIQKYFQLKKFWIRLREASTVHIYGIKEMRPSLKLEGWDKRQYWQLQVENSHHFEFERANAPNCEVRRTHQDSNRGNRGKEKEKKSKDKERNHSVSPLSLYLCPSLSSVPPSLLPSLSLSLSQHTLSLFHSHSTSMRSELWMWRLAWHSKVSHTGDSSNRCHTEHIPPVSHRYIYNNTSMQAFVLLSLVQCYVTSHIYGHMLISIGVAICIQKQRCLLLGNAYIHLIKLTS